MNQQTDYIRFVESANIDNVIFIRAPNEVSLSGYFSTVNCISAAVAVSQTLRFNENRERMKNEKKKNRMENEMWNEKKAME